MTKKYVELTVSYDDATNTLEQSRREKEDEGDWTAPTEVQKCAPRSLIALPWIQLEMKLEV